MVGLKLGESQTRFELSVNQTHGDRNAGKQSELELRVCF